MSKFNEQHCLAGWIFLPAMFLLNMVLPNSWGEGNGVLINIQVVWLVLGAVWCWSMARKKDLPDWGGDASAFWYSGLLLFVLLIGEELSWGGVFFLDEVGQAVQWEEMGLYGKLVQPLIWTLILLMVWFLWRSKFWIFLKQMWHVFPYADIFLFIVFEVFQYVAEDTFIPWWTGEVAEELAETGAYFVLEWLTKKVAAQYRSPSF